MGISSPGPVRQIRPNAAPSAVPICQSCGSVGHHSRRSRPRLRWRAPTGNAASASGDQLNAQSLPSASLIGYKDILFTTFSEYAKFRLGLSSPPPLIVLWSRSWRIAALEFEDIDEGSALTVTAPSQPPIFSSFGELACSVLGFTSAPSHCSHCLEPKNPSPCSLFFP